MPDRPDPDPRSVLAALDGDERLRPFVRDGQIAVLPARRARRRLLLDAIAHAAICPASSCAGTSTVTRVDGAPWPAPVPSPGASRPPRQAARASTR